MAVADQLGDVAHGDRRLLGQKLRGRGHASREQVLVKARLAELRVGALHLARRAGDRARDRGERQPPAVVARDDDAREQVQPSSAGERLRLHIPPLRPCTPSRDKTLAPAKRQDARAGEAQDGRGPRAALPGRSSGVERRRAATSRSSVRRCAQA